VRFAISLQIIQKFHRGRSSDEVPTIFSIEKKVYSVFDETKAQIRPLRDNHVGRWLV